MKYRKLRITFSAVCGVFCLLLIALWVRSYAGEVDIYFQIVPSFGHTLCLARGELELLSEPREPDELIPWPWPNENGDQQLITIETIDGFHALWEFDGDGLWHDLGFAAFTYPMGVQKVAIPFWFVTLISICGGLIPWIRWSKRFSLRTMLIATTLVAVVLGLIFATSR